MALVVHTLHMACTQAMEPFHPRPFHKVGNTRDEVATLKRQYERMPHERRMASGKKMSGDSGVIDLTAMQAQNDAANAAAKAAEDLGKRDSKPHGQSHSKFNQVLKGFKSAFSAAEDGDGNTPVWAFQKANKNSKWDDKKMHKLIESAPAGKKRYFETVGILQKAGVDLGQLDGKHKGGRDRGGETAIDIDKIPQNKRGFFKSQEKMAKNPEKVERWEALKKKAENKGWKDVHGEMTKLDHNGNPVAPERVSRRSKPSSRRLLLDPGNTG